MADNFAQTVKQQTDVVRIVGEYLKLRKSGANWSALCPFHKEKSGSFYLYPANATYYCFGCHEHGDVFTLLHHLESKRLQRVEHPAFRRVNRELRHWPLR